MMSNSKLEATYHPEAPYECDICEKRYISASSAKHCCSDWLELGED